MKSILISIQPQWVEKILNGEKTIEIRKTMPSCELPVKVYIYCAKPKKWFRYSSCGVTSDEFLWKHKDKIKMCAGFEFYDVIRDCITLNGKVVAEFTLNKIERCGEAVNDVVRCDTWNEWNDLSLNDACVHPYDLEEYSNGHELYAWHIDNLKIYNEPKELREFKTPPCNKSESSCRNCKYLEVINTPDTYECNCWVESGRILTRPPQSWGYVQELEEV